MCPIRSKLLHGRSCDNNIISTICDIFPCNQNQNQRIGIIYLVIFQTQETSAMTISGRCHRGHLIIQICGYFRIKYNNTDTYNRIFMFSTLLLVRARL